MTPSVTNPSNWTDDSAQSAPTSPWTDALHQAWSPGYETEEADDGSDGREDPTEDPLTSAYL